MTIFGDGKQTRAFSHIDDVAPLISRSTRNSKAYQEAFNIGADKPYTVLELAEEVAKALDKPHSIQRLEARNEVVDAYASHDKIREFFDCENPISLTEGIRSMAESVLQSGPASPEEFGNIEIEKSMPEPWRKAFL